MENASNPHNQPQTTATVVIMMSSFLLCTVLRVHSQWSDSVSHKVVTIEQLAEITASLEARASLRMAGCYQQSNRTVHLRSQELDDLQIVIEDNMWQ